MQINMGSGQFLFDQQRGTKKKNLPQCERRGNFIAEHRGRSQQNQRQLPWQREQQH